MKTHFFQPDPDADPEERPDGVDLCALCGEPPEASVHELDFEPPDDPEPADDFPPTTRSFLDSIGHRDPEGT